MTGIALRGMDNNIFTQIGLIVLVGLASKNAILIVEFANQSREKGMTIAQAALHAVEQRLRPILMTTIAALAGFFPLVNASGAGAASRVSVGTAVFGGLFISAIFSLLLVPVLYVVVKNLTDFGSKGKPPEPPQSPDSTPSSGLGLAENSHLPATPVLKSQGDAPA